MAKKIRRIRTFARTATKSQEKSLIENAKRLIQDPFIIIPQCIDDSSKKYFIKIRKKIEKINRYTNDSEKLEKFANKKGLDAAFAGTALIAISEKAPYLGVLKFPTGDITYAQRGKAEKEKLIAVQHFNDPILRLLGVKDISFKKGLYIYSWDNHFVCSGKDPKPPKEFIDFIIEKLGLKYKNDICSCNHIDIDKIKNKDYSSKYYLRIFWKSADIIISVCTDCAKSSKNTIFNISKYMLNPDLSKDFEIDVVAEVIKKIDHLSQKDTLYLEKYLSGELSDYEFINKNVQSREEKITQSEEKILVLDGVSYGSDVNGFIDKLKPKKYEYNALKFILESIDEPLVVSDTTSNRILEVYWDNYGNQYIKTEIDDENMAESFFNLDDTPSNILKMVFEYKQRQNILIQLPHFESLPPLASFADDIARTYKTFGKKNALVKIKKRPDSPKGKSLAYAFLLAFKNEKDSKWKYSSDEIEYGEFIMPYADNLLNSDPKKYKENLQELLNAIGSSETI